jgi:amidohydrolase
LTAAAPVFTLWPISTDFGLFAQASAEVDAAMPTLVALSRDIHAHPELGFEEERASAWLADALADRGYDVSAGVGGLPTAFVATYGKGPLTIALCAEYDALPGIGHACGHNVIAAAAVGAAAALVDAADDLGVTVKVIGTPAEEGGGGKILLLEAGAFDGVHAAMMVHPAPRDSAAIHCKAVSHFDVHFDGVEAHAAAAPERGVNAADAMTIAQVGIGLLRQHLGAGQQVHGIVTKGGDAANVIPSDVSGRFYARAATLAELSTLEPRVHACFRAGALATGATLTIKAGLPYSELRSDPWLAARYQAHAEALGRTFPRPGDRPVLTASTDMGNVSLQIPTIHPMIGIEAGGAVNHQRAFADACASPSAELAVRDGAVAMAGTVIDAASDASLRAHLLGGGA